MSIPVTNHPEGKAWLDGLRARQANHPKNANPHVNTNKALEAAWDQGWCDTDAIMATCHAC